MPSNPLLLVYLLPLLALWTGWIAFGKWRSRRNLAVLEDNLQAGLSEPTSLHPTIDPATCLGCASCVKACPEKRVLGIVDGKARLIEPTSCVGHGACATACPTAAITLVFGTERRGVDIPVLKPNFETSVPGIFIAGELGGMGLIRNAIEQGRQAIEAAAERARQVASGEGVLDTLIVGCGPAGISASLGAMERGLAFRTVDQSTLGGTVAHYPRGKVVMTAPATLPIVGTVHFGEVSKEKLLSFWEGVLEQTGLEPQFDEQVSAIMPFGDAFSVVTTKDTYLAKSVVLAIGRRGTPRTLGVAGEDQEKVVYRLIDPEQYAGKRVLVVGGGDSALEAAAQLAEQVGTEVTLSYRGNAFGRARAKNRERVSELADTGRLTQFLESTVSRIAHDNVELSHMGELRTIPNDAVIVCAGGILPTQFLKDVGINIETKYGTA